MFYLKNLVSFMTLSINFFDGVNGLFTLEIFFFFLKNPIKSRYYLKIFLVDAQINSPISARIYGKSTINLTGLAQKQSYSTIIKSMSLYRKKAGSKFKCLLQKHAGSLIRSNFYQTIKSQKIKSLKNLRSTIISNFLRILCYKYSPIKSDVVLKFV